MKTSLSKMRVLIAFLTILLTPAVFAQTNVLFGNVTDFGLAPRSNITMTLSIVSPLNRTYNGQLVSNDPKTATTDTNGLFSFTNVIWGNYKLNPSDSSGTVWRPIVGTNTTGTVSFATIIANPSVLPPNPATNYYTQAQIDALLYGITSSGLTNAYATNAAGVIVTNRVAFISTNYASTSITNGLATTNYVNTATNGLVTASVTNGLATTNFVNTSIENKTNFASITVTNDINRGDASDIGKSLNISLGGSAATSPGVGGDGGTVNIASGVNGNGLAGLGGNGGTVTIAQGGTSGLNAVSGGNGGTVNIANASPKGTAGTVNIATNGSTYVGNLTIKSNAIVNGIIANDSGDLNISQNLGGNTGRNINIQADDSPDSSAGGVTILGGNASDSNGGGILIKAGNGTSIGGDVTISSGTNSTSPNTANSISLKSYSAGYGMSGQIDIAGSTIFSSNVYFGSNLYVTNHAYDVSTSRLDPLANEFVTAEYVQSVMAANFDLYFSTNTSGITVTNGSGGLFIPSTMVLVNPSTSQTNTISSFTNGTYFTARLQTNSISYIQSVPINLYSYVQITGGGSVTAHPEMWLYNTNGTIVQLGYSSDNTYSSDIAVPVNLAIAMTNTAYLNVNLTNSPKLLLRWYVTSKTGNPTWKFLIGAGNVSHITVGTIPSANQNYVGTFTGNGSSLTNIPATGIVGTAVTNNASATFTGLSVGAQTALDVNGNGKFGGVGLTNGVLTGNGSGITNVSASLPPGTVSLAIGSLTLTNAITIKTNSTIPTLVQNVNTTCIPSSFIDSTSNDGLIILSYLAAAGTTMPPNSNYFTITLSQPATSTNSLIVIPTANVTLPASGQTIAANSTLNRFNVFASSNSFTLASGTSVPPVGMTNQLIYLQVYRR